MSSIESRRGAGIAVVPNVVYGKRHEIPLSFDVYRPSAGNGAAVLFINSGGFVSGQLSQYAEKGQSGYRFLEPHELTVQGVPHPIPLLSQFSFAGLLTHGITVFDVRHSNHPPTMLDEMVEDVHHAARFIREHSAEYDVDTARLGVWGASAGGYLALHLGLAFEGEPFAAIATYYPAGYDFVSDIDRFPDLSHALPMLGIARNALDALGLKQHVRKDAPPTLIVYGKDDMPFITEPCEALCKELQGGVGDVRCVVIPGTGHEFSGEDGYHEEHGAHAYAEMVAWFARYLSL